MDLSRPPHCCRRTHRWRRRGRPCSRYRPRRSMYTRMKPEENEIIVLSSARGPLLLGDATLVSELWQPLFRVYVSVFQNSSGHLVTYMGDLLGHMQCIDTRPFTWETVWVSYILFGIILLLSCQILANQKVVKFFIYVYPDSREIGQVSMSFICQSKSPA